MHIAEHGMDEGSENPVQRFVVAFKGGRDGDVGMDHLDPFGVGIPQNFEATEAEPGEFGLRHAGGSVGRYGENLFVDVFRVNGPVGKKFFGKINRYGLEFRGIQRKHRVSHGVFPAIVYGAAPRPRADLFQRENFLKSVDGTVGLAIFRVRCLGGNGKGPSAVVESVTEAIGMKREVLFFGFVGSFKKKDVKDRLILKSLLTLAKTYSIHREV